MQQVTNCLREGLELSYSSLSFKDARVFFFPRISYNLFFRLDYPIVFVSLTNILLGRDGEGPCLTRVVVALTLRGGLLAYKRDVCNGGTL